MAELQEAQQALRGSSQSRAAARGRLRALGLLPPLRGQAQGAPPSEKGAPLKRGCARQAPRRMAELQEAQQARQGSSQSCPAAQARLRPQLGARPQRSKWLLQRVPNEGILGARGKKGCAGELKRTVLRKF